MNNKEKGRIGEDIATKYLLDKNIELIERNYTTKCGEIDLIVNDNGCLTFVEVKARSSVRYGYPSESVNKNKKLKIVNTAKVFMIKNKIENIPIRFDVIEVYLNESKINHIENAFYGEGIC